MERAKIFKWVFYICIFLLLSMTLLMWGFASEYTTLNYTLTVSSLTAIVVIFLLEREAISRNLRADYTKNLFSDLTTFFLAVCILGMVNYLIFKNNKSFDVTTTKIHTLSLQSQSILSYFKEEVKVILFARRDQWDQYLELLKQYQLINQNLKIQAIDVEENPALVKVHGITDEGSISLEYRGKKIKGRVTSELDVTNLFLKLQRSKEITIGYTVGHGELNLEGAASSDANFLKQKLEERNYTLGQLDLLAVDKIPKDVNLLMIVGMNSGMLDLEVKKIRDFLERGGSLFFSFGPNFENKDWKNLEKLFEDYGIKLTNTIVIDRLSKVQGSEATIPIITQFNKSQSIGRSMDGRLVMPLASAILPIEKDEIEYQWIARTSGFPASWAESDLIGVVRGKATVDSSDFEGPIDVVAIATNKKNMSKYAVWGSTNSLANHYASNAPNFNLFLNIVAWLADDEGLLAVNRPGLRGERVFLASSQMTLIFWGAIVVIPLVFSFLGIYFYRRKLIK